MSKPNNALATVKIPGDSTARPIVPYYIGYSASNNYVATIPNITYDNTIALTSYDNTFYGIQCFENYTGSAPAKFNFNNNDNFAFIVYDDSSQHKINFDINGTLSSDISIHFPVVEGTLSIVEANPSTTTETLTGITINGTSYGIQGGGAAIPIIDLRS